MLPDPLDLGEKEGRLDEKARSLIITLTEYGVLKDEILKRIEIRFQLMALAVVAPGTIITVGLQTKNASLMLIYPILSMFLSAAFTSNEHQIKQIREYILKRIEAKLGEDNMGWQHFSYDILMKKPVTMRVLASVGIFSGTGLVAILGSLSFLNFDIYNKVLLVISILSVLIMPFILRGIHVRKISDKTIIQPRCQMKQRRMIRIFDHSGA